MIKYNIGIDIGGSHIRLGIVEDYKILDTEEIYISKKDVETEELAIKFLEKNIANLYDVVLRRNMINTDNIIKVGVSTPGEIIEGVIYNAKNLNINKYNILAFIKSLTLKSELNIKIRNDGYAGILAEKKYGNLQDIDNCIFLSIGTGIGGGVIINGEFITNSKGGALELGHMMIEQNGRLCSCGKKGCFEKYCSMSALRNEIKTAIDTEDFIDIKKILESLDNKENKNNEIIKKILNEYLEKLALSLISISDIFEPEVICLGGSFSELKETRIFKLLIEKFEKMPRFGKWGKPKIVPAYFENNGTIIGALV